MPNIIKMLISVPYYTADKWLAYQIRHRQTNRLSVSQKYNQKSKTSSLFYHVCLSYGCDMNLSDFQNGANIVTTL